MKIAVSGGRTFGEYIFGKDRQVTRDEIASVRFSLDHALTLMRARFGNNEKLILIEGGAKGADTRAREWAIDRWQRYNEDIEVVTVEAEWSKYGKSAGFRRNVRMSNLPSYGPPDLWVIFPGGPGTAHARSVAVQCKIQIMDVNPDDPNSQRPQELNIVAPPQRNGIIKVSNDPSVGTHKVDGNGG